MFLYYYFNSQPGLHALDTIRRHVAVVGITGKDLTGIGIKLPPLPEQSAIAHILGTLDDKIELNRRMNETLEAMARALFKSWFVDFDPVSPPRTPRQATSLVPAGLAHSPLEQIPEGWRVGVLDEMIQILTGGYT